MIRKLALALSLLALVLFGLAACGGDDEEDASTEVAPAEPAKPAADADADAGGSSAIEIVADPSGSLAYETTEAETAAGAVDITLVNDSSVPHDVQVEGPDGDLGGTETVSATTTTASVNLAAGDYTFYCSVGGHREAGMEGSLTVK